MHDDDYLDLSEDNDSACHGDIWLQAEMETYPTLTPADLLDIAGNVRGIILEGTLDDLLEVCVALRERWGPDQAGAIVDAAYAGVELTE
jgi:hypothetical protein